MVLQVYCIVMRGVMVTAGIICGSLNHVTLGYTGVL